MVRLNLGRNRIDKIPSEALANLRYLEILDLTENEISKIEAGDFRGEYFVHMLLGANLIKLTFS